MLINYKKEKKSAMKQTIHYALILDQSGSMLTLRKEVITSFNEQIDLIRKLQKENPESIFKITLCVFNEKVDFLFSFESTNQLKKLKPEDYNPDSCTALYDAMGITLLKLKENVLIGDKVFIAIFTDGIENASTVYNANDIRYKINEVEKDGWQVKFFCRYDDSFYYERKLNFSKRNLFCLNFSQNFIEEMETEIGSSLNEMINPPKSKE